MNTRQYSQQYTYTMQLMYWGIEGHDGELSRESQKLQYFYKLVEPHSINL